MKKLLAIISSTIISSVFAYNATITNNIGTTVTIQSQQGSQTIGPGATKSFSLDPYTTYNFTYQGQWAPQGIMTIQKYTNLVAQTTPRTPANGLLNIKINLNADNTLGYVDILTQNGLDVYGGICNYDTGGVTCTLAQGINLNQLNVNLSLIP